MFKHAMRTALFILLVGLLAAACVAPTPVADQAAPAPTAAALPVETTASVASVDKPAADSASPAEVTAAFYTWYLDYIGQTGSETMRNPLVDGAYRASPYLTQSFIGHIDELLAEMRAQDRGGYDPFLCAQDVPTEMTPDVTFMRNDMASVVVRSSFPNHLRRYRSKQRHPGSLFQHQSRQ
jgi:hypothetical protein